MPLPLINKQQVLHDIDEQLVIVRLILPCFDRVYRVLDNASRASLIGQFLHARSGAAEDTEGFPVQQAQRRPWAADAHGGCAIHVAAARAACADAGGCVTPPGEFRAAPFSKAPLQG
jgi:hypothetical protein